MKMTEQEIIYATKSIAKLRESSRDSERRLMKRKMEAKAKIEYREYEKQTEL